ncbi:MAG: diguanylate cyclase [Betaproteobacteria bacterium]|nr:diguanylate cyclase [Betaproteobacteria bacterium]
MASNPTDQSWLTRNTLAAVRELDIAISHHIAWLKELHSNLICDTPISPANLLADAHHRCNFGQWFYSEGMEKFHAEPGFMRIEEVHRAMHDAVRVMLQRRAAVMAIQKQDYEHFMDLAIQFKQDVRTFQYTLINRVCTVDHLTGTWNRHAMVMKLAEEYERTQRTGQTCALCMMDLDHFKVVNDQHGHKAGDEVLQYVTTLVTTELRRYDSLCRYGGEEFLILLPNTDLENAASLLNRIREKLADNPIRVESGHEIPLTASFGVTHMAREEALEEAVEHADHALLAAKAQGRNKVCVWNVLLPER